MGHDRKSDSVCRLSILWLSFIITKLLFWSLLFKNKSRFYYLRRLKRRAFDKKLRYFWLEEKHSRNLKEDFLF